MPPDSCSCPYAICLATEDGSGKVMICLNWVPCRGDQVKVTKENLYRGGSRGVPEFNTGNMLGKNWLVIRSVKLRRSYNYVILVVREIQ